MNAVTKDAYTWQVRYTDDTFLPEFDDELAVGRGFAEVDQTRVHTLYLVGQGRAYNVRIPGDAAPVFFRRRSRFINVADGNVTQGETVHCIGWKRQESGVYLFVWDSGQTLLTSDLQAV